MSELENEAGQTVPNQGSMYTSDSKFFTFINPFLSLIDKGALYKQPFKWLYVCLAIGNILIPFILFYNSRMIFYMQPKYIVAFLFVWLFVAFAAWVGFQIWWNRKDKVLQTSSEHSDFPATPVISHLVQTIGEWFGVWIAIVGFGVALVTTVFLNEEAHFLKLPFVQSGGLFIVLMPVLGFIIIVFSRFVAEQIRALASIANNTKGARQ
jgi:hypothetical protein